MDDWNFVAESSATVEVKFLLVAFCGAKSELLSLASCITQMNEGVNKSRLCRADRHFQFCLRWHLQ